MPLRHTRNIDPVALLHFFHQIPRQRFLNKDLHALDALRNPRQRLHR